MITSNPRLRDTAQTPLRAWALWPGAALLALTGCITVKTPDKPIVIELNVNIKQEVVYRLQGDAAQTIDKNAEIF